MEIYATVFHLLFFFHSISSVVSFFRATIILHIPIHTYSTQMVQLDRKIPKLPYWDFARYLTALLHKSGHFSAERKSLGLLAGEELVADDILVVVRVVKSGFGQDNTGGSAGQLHRGARSALPY